MADWTNESLKDDGAAIGQFKDGIDTFPLSELPQRLAQREAQETMIQKATAMADDVLDLDSLSVEELDQIIQGNGESGEKSE